MTELEHGSVVTFSDKTQEFDRWPGAGRTTVRYGDKGRVIAGPNRKGNYRVSFRDGTVTPWLSARQFTVDG